MFATEVFGSNIRKYRQLCGLTLEELAWRIGVAVQTLHRWETGKFFPSSFYRLDDLAVALGVSVSDLFVLPSTVAA